MVRALRVSKAHTICASCKKARLSGVIYIVRTEKVAFICCGCHDRGEMPLQYKKGLLGNPEGRRLKLTQSSTVN